MPSPFNVPIVRIDVVYPHDNADKLEIVTLEGMSYRCIVQKGMYNPGDAAFYIPVDAVVPPTIVDVLNLDYFKSNGRVRAVKLRGIYSEGIVMPLRKEFGVDWDKYKMGDDVSKEFGITKYQPPQRGESFRGRKARYSHPDFIKYTDIDNIKKNPKILDGKNVIVTEKLHGTNTRMGFLKKYNPSIIDRFMGFFSDKRKYEFIVGSHNVQLKTDSDNIYTRVAKKYEKKLFEFKDHIFFGEIIGPGVQKNYDYSLKEHDIIFFDIFDVKNKKYLDYAQFKLACDLLGLKRVPEIYNTTWGFLKQAKPNGPSGKSYFDQHQKVIEGWVIKPRKERWDQRCGRVIFKWLNEKYLLDKNNTDYN